MVGLFRFTSPCFVATIKTWMPGTSPGMTEKQKGPGKTGAFDFIANEISGNRIRRSDAGPSEPRTARPTDAARGRILRSSSHDRLRGSQARRAREAGWLRARG